MVRTSTGVGVFDPNTHVPAGPVKVLHEDDMKTLDSFWQDGTLKAVNESQVSDAAKRHTLRLLAIMIIGSRRDLPNCGDFDLHGIRKLELSTVPVSIVEKAKVQVPAPTFAEKWSVVACDDETKWLVIGANGMPYISVAPSEL